MPRHAWRWPLQTVVGCALLLLSSCSGEKHEVPPVSAFELIPNAAVKLQERGHAPVLRTGRLQAEATLQDSGSKLLEQKDDQETRGTAEIHLVEQKDLSIDVRLRTSSLAEEGTSATSEARATIKLRLPASLPGRSGILRINATHREGLRVEVARPDGTILSPLAGRPGWYLIERADTEAAEIRTTVRTTADAETLHGEQADVTLRASLEAGPLMFSLRAQPFIHGGTDTSAYEQVGSIRIDGLPHCTGTLVAARTILTAAHCIEPWRDQVSAGRMTFAIGPRALAPARVFRIIGYDYPRDPQGGFQYKPSNYKDDLGLLYLHPDDNTNLSPLPIHSGPPAWNDFQQERLLFVGYGFNDLTSVPADNGVKREARWRINRLDSRLFAWTNPTTSTCHGDSGGPAFREGPGLLIVGVTSVGNPGACTEGSDTRLDVYRPWLAGRLR